MVQREVENQNANKCIFFIRNSFYVNLISYLNPLFNFLDKVRYILNKTFSKHENQVLPALKAHLTDTKLQCPVMVLNIAWWARFSFGNN